VGAALKRIRQDRGLPAYQLADQLDWTPSHISRSEAGKRRVTDVDAGHYLGMCGVPKGELQELLKVVNESDDYRLQRHQGGIPDEMRTLIFFEVRHEALDVRVGVRGPCRPVVAAVG